MRKRQNLIRLVLIFGTLVLLLAAAFITRPAFVSAVGSLVTYLPLVEKGYFPQTSAFVVVGWNDLGMHCYDRDYSTSSVLPPYNNLYAQLIQRGDPPQIVTSGFTVEYSFPSNTYSVGKTNFWDYAQKLFGVTLAPNVGLAGKGMSGLMDAVGNHFVAEGVPITEFSDVSPSPPDYYQMAKLVAKDGIGNVVAVTNFVVPISSEMRCDVCHNQPSPTNFRMNILQKHDQEEGTGLAAQAQAGNPVLCAGCHADPALGLTGNPELPSLSAAMHRQHAEETSNCYACHPGPLTQCLRDVMSQQFGLTCTDCHVGGMSALGQTNRTPWVDLPRCGNCHASQFAENSGMLYKLSTGHGGMYCESCHNSTHAILKSREPKDNAQSVIFQGYAGTLQDCTICHLTRPASGGPHQ